MKTSTSLRPLFIVTLFALATLNLQAQLSFTNANSKLQNSNFRSGCSVTVVDVNFDGLDDILRMDLGHYLNLEIQERDGNFTNYYLDDIGGGSAWAMTAADVDHNGWKDVVTDGTGGIRFIKIFESAGNITVTNTLLGNSGFFLQNATFCDMNNDGWIDLFCCDDNDASHLYLNDGTGNLNISSFVSFAVNPTIFYGGDPADSGNYGSAWIDFDNDGDLDLFVAHCRQSTSSPTDLRRKDRLFVNDGNNVFTDQSTAYGIETTDFWQTWTASFGDIDNDGDLDLMVTNHDHFSQIFENDGTGHYSELLNTGFNTNSITPIESVMEDFDNDGYLDILVAGSEWVYYKNNGNKTFTQVSGLFANNGMLSFATGDLNHDGYIDIYASYGDIYQNPSNTFDDVLYLNDAKSGNNFITFNLTGTVSNKGAIGGRATIYGPWGVQIREVRAGESYGTCNSSQLHFGIGQNTVIDSAVISWPSGLTTTFGQLDAGQFVSVVEGGCIITGNIIPGPFILCTGQTLNLNAANGFTSYNWSTGATTQSITVSTGGTYNVMVTDASGCNNISATVTVLLNPDETPTVSASGPLQFCQGGSVTLTSSAATSYLWSNGNTTQSITVNQSGTYSLTILGVCGIFNSAPVVVDVLAAPLPVATGASGIGPTSLVLTATGDSLFWYDQQTGGTLLGTGPSFTTPILTTTTTYWVENATSYPGPINFTGQTYHQGTLYSGGTTTNGTNDFDVISNSTLVSVKVYTDTPGNREIQLKNAGGTVLQSLLVNIPMDSSLITLNFPLTPGTGYELTTNPTVNTSTLGTITPRLQRSSAGVSYPYTINNIVSITGSNQGPGYYYYFYDWEVQEAPTVCVSDRVAVIADITTGIADNLAYNNGVKIFPNPASDHLMITLANPAETQVFIFDALSRVVKQVSFNSAENSLSIADLSAGIYQLRLTQNGSSYNYKLSVR